MQNLFKRSLATVLAVMMVITMFAGAITAFAEGLEPFTSFAGTNTHLFHMASLAAETKDAPNGLDMQYLAQEFVPGTDTISGVKLNFNLTSGSAVLHVELRKDSVTNAAFYSKEATVTSVGDTNNNFYTVNFGENVEVVPGDVYYLGFWFVSKSSDGIVAIACGGATESGHYLYRHKRFDSEGTKYEPETASFKVVDGSAVGFEIISEKVAENASGEVVFFDDFMPHHAADRGKWEKDTTNYLTGDFAYRAMADYRSGDKLSHSRLYRDDPVDITSLYNENGEFYLTFDFYADPDYIGKADHYDNDNNLVETKNFGLENTRFLILLYSKGENQTATDPKSGKQAVEVTKWEPSNANANETNNWSMFGLENGLQPGWNRMALKMTDKDGVLSYGKSGQEQYWDPTKMWGISFLIRAANWQDKYDQHGTVEVVFDNIKFMSVEAYEETVAPIDYNYQLRNCDETGWQNTPRGEFYPDTATYTEGEGSIRTALDWRSGSKLMNAWLGSIDGRQANTDTLDISKAIDENGDFYVTFDLWADPEYTTSAKNYNETTGEVDNTLTTGLNAGRLVVGLVTRGEGQTTTAMDNATISMEMIKPAGTDWTSFGLENGLQPGWNHIAIKANANSLKSGGEAAWDPSKLWGVKFNYDSLNWKDPKEAHGTVEVRFDDLRFMSVAAYEADFARVNAAKDAIAAIAEVKDADDEVGIAKATEAYKNVPANAKYLVTNYDKMADLNVVVDIEVEGANREDPGMGWILVGNGPDDNTPYKVTPTPWTETYTEGTHAAKVQWGEGSQKTKMHIAVLGIDKYWDFSEAQYVTFDLYVHGWKVGDTSKDANFGFGTTNDAGQWSNQNLAWVGKDTVLSWATNLQEGWNHIVMEIPAAARKESVGNMRLFFEGGITVTAAEGDAAYAIFDDFRVVNANGLKVDTNRAEAKKVITGIQAMKTAEDVKALRTAYDALTEAQQLYVFNYADLEALEAKVLAGEDVDAAFAALKNKVTVYHPTDAADNSVVNINSGAWNVTAENGAIKAIAKNDITKNAFCVGFRADAVNLNDYDTMTFDLFIPEGVTVPDDTYGYAYFADKHTNNQDERVWRYEIKAQALAAQKGTWTTITVPVADQNYSGIIQITVRLAVTTAANGYVLIDNLQFNKAIDELTFAEKDAIEAVYAQYEALEEKSFATCGDELVALKETMDAKQVALDDANAKIAAIPAIDSLGLLDKFAIDAASAAYEALDEDVKPFAVGADTIAAAYAKIDELYANASAEELAAFIDETIMSSLPSADEVTLEDAELVANVASVYESLGEAKALVSKAATSKLYALRVVIAALQADADAAAQVDALIADLKAELTLEDKDAVYAARDAFAALNDNAKANVVNKDKLDAAVAAMDKLVADDEAIKALTDAINALADDATAEDIQAVVDLYNAANGDVIAALDSDVAAKYEAAKAKLINMEPYNIQFRSFDQTRLNDLNVEDIGAGVWSAGQKGDIPAEGTKYFWVNSLKETNRMFLYVYGHKQNADVDANGNNPEGTVDYYVSDINDMYITFDFYVSNAELLKSTNDAGLGVDTKQGGGSSQWGNTFKVEGKVVKEMIAGLEDGWNHVVLPLIWSDKTKGAKLTGTAVRIESLRFYINNVTLPADFVAGMDDIRFANGAAVNTIDAQRAAAKEVTYAIRNYPAEATADDFYAVYLRYNAVADEYKDVIIGWDEFLAANADKQAAADETLAVDKAAADAVIAQIAALDKEITVDDKADIDAAKEALGKLSDNQKLLVNNTYILNEADAGYEAAVKAAADKEAADAVIALIDALPETVSGTDVTNTDIADAREAYDALTDAQKAIVGDKLAKLEAAEANLVIAIDMAAAAEVQALIDALPTPTDVYEDDVDAINAAAEAYGKLTAAQKAYLAEGAAEKLAACVEAAQDPKPLVDLGDANGDGVIDAKDALSVLRMTVGKEAENAAADVNKDGKVNASDALEILKYVVGKPSVLDAK